MSKILALIPPQTGFILFLTLLGTFENQAQTYQDQLSSYQNKAQQYFYTNKDSTYYYCDKIYEIAVEHNDVITSIDILIYLCVSAGYSFDTDKIQSSLQLLDTLVAQNKIVLDTLADRGAYQKNYINYNKGNYYHKLEDYKQAQFYFDQIVSNITKSNNFVTDTDALGFLSTCYSFIADINAEQDRFEVADQYYKKNIRLFKEHMPEDIEGLHKVYNLYASSLYFQKKYDEANDYLRKTLLYAETNFNENKRNSVVSTSLLLAKSYGENGQLDSAYYYLDKINSYKIPNDPFAFRYVTAKADFLVLEKSFQKAEQSFLEALALAPAGNQPALFHKIGNLYSEQKIWDKALANYQKGLGGLLGNFDTSNIKANPSPTKVAQKQELLRLLRSKLATLARKGKTQDQGIQLSTIDSTMATIDLLKPKFKNEKDKAFLVEEAFPAFEASIELLYQLENAEKRWSYQEKIFQLFEKSKAVVLLGALLGSQANKFSKIPIDLINEEKSLKSEILVLEKKIVLNGDESTGLENQLFEIKTQYRELVEKIEKNYKAYYDLKYNNATTNLKTFQKQLDAQTMAISYFYGNSAIYGFGIDKNNIELHKIPLKDSLTDKIISFHKKVQNPKSKIPNLALEGKVLFDALVSPFNYKTHHTKFLIMPDGPLNYLPFGALNTANEGLTYFIEKAAIAYTNSATILEQLSFKKTDATNLLAVAPSFEGTTITPGITRDALLPLAHNQSEVKSILTYFDGVGLTKDQGSLQNFNAAVPKNFGMLHFATHAVFDDTKPEYSYLAFSPNTKDAFLLYVRDLYEIEINAELVTLSACETGIGELKRGEGFIGLARGFFYSGAASIASTLWKVNDASSTQLMENFYKNLADGDQKDQALQKAKLQFLKTNSQNARVHPYYWSGYIISGNTRPVTSNSWWMYALPLLIVLVAACIFMYKKSRS